MICGSMDVDMVHGYGVINSYFRHSPNRKTRGESKSHKVMDWADLLNWKAPFILISSIELWSSLGCQSKRNPTSMLISFPSRIFQFASQTRLWSLNLAPMIFAQQLNWNCKWLVFFTRFARCAPTLSAVKAENLEKGNLPNDTPSVLPVAPSSTSEYFSHWKFSPQHLLVQVQTQSWRLVQSVACLETGAVAWVTGAWIRGSRGSKMPNFSTTPAPVSPPPVRFVCSSFEQVHRGGINNISKCRLGTGAMTGVFPAGKGVGCWSAGAKNWLLIHTQSLSPCQNHVVTHLCLVCLGKLFSTFDFDSSLSLYSDQS